MAAVIGKSHGVGKESVFIDDLTLLIYIAKLGLNYVLVGSPIRRKFRELQRAGGKF